MTKKVVFTFLLVHFRQTLKGKDNAVGSHFRGIRRSIQLYRREDTRWLWAIIIYLVMCNVLLDCWWNQYFSSSALFFLFCLWERRKGIPRNNEILLLFSMCFCGVNFRAGNIFEVTIFISIWWCLKYSRKFSIVCVMWHIQIFIIFKAWIWIYKQNIITNVY